MEFIEVSLEEREAIKNAVKEILEKNLCHRGRLLPILQEVQERFGYLPREAMEQIASSLQIPKVDVYSVATFYNQFRLNPPGKYQIKVCMGTACHMAGGHIVMESFERRLNIKEGETTPDREFSLERVACVGCCALAPVVVVNENVEGKVRPTRVDGILMSLGKEILKKAGKEEKPEEGREG